MLRALRKTFEKVSPVQRTGTLTIKELLFQPFWSTAQEKEFLSLLRGVPWKICVVKSYRGCRKSTTAQRVATRLKCFHPAMGLWPYRLRVIYIDNLADYERLFWRDSVTLQRQRGIVLIIVWGAIAYYISAKASGRSDSADGGRIVLHIPGVSDMLAFVSVLLFACFRFRKRVFVIDDLLRFLPYGPRKAGKVQAALGKIKSQALIGRALSVVMSSNEGIHRLFSDKNTSTYGVAAFPQPSDEEMVQALRRCHLPITAEQFEEAKRRFEGSPHHLYSTRWWLIVADKVPSIPRSVLFEVALRLDLQCEAVGMAYELSYSEEVDVAVALKNIFDDAEVAAIVKDYGPRGPRRLVLTAGLLVTGREAGNAGKLALLVSAVDKLQEQWMKLPTAASEAALEEATMILEHMTKYVAQNQLATAIDPVVAAAEAGFSNEVKRALEPDSEIFQADERCIKEIRRIKRLM